MWKLLVILIILVLSLILFYVVYPQLSEEFFKVDEFKDFEMVHFNLIGESYMNFSRYYIRDFVSLFNNENFDFNRKTVLYCHGWLENFDSENAMTVVNAYLQRGDHNIIVMDWGQYSFAGYFSVIPRFTQIAKMLAKLLIEMFERGLSVNRLHCVGHSFGSHTFGIAGREIIRKSYGKYKLKRISALDPAHFGFFPPLLETSLSKNDAEFVDAIHTDVSFIGTMNRVGHVDFFPNGGYLQPGCPPFKFKSYMDIVNSFCSHQHGWRYWAESVKQEDVFPALKCKNYKNFKDGRCNGNQINFMGLGAKKSAPGTFYNELQSNMDYTVDESYYIYLATSFSYRSDFLRIVSRLQELYTAITQQ